MNEPLGVAFDPFGNLFVANRGVNNILKINPNGCVSVFASGLNRPYAVAFDAGGNLYVANQSGNTIVKYDGKGQGTLFADSGLSQPVGLAFDAAGNLYVANAGNSTIQKFTPDRNGSLFADTGLNNPIGLAFDSGGNLLVANYGDSSIWSFTPEGVGTLFADAGLSFPESIAVVPEPTNSPAILLLAPTYQSVFVGDSARFAVFAGGLPIFGYPGSYDYQWKHNGTNLIGATNAVLLLNDVRLEQVGTYSVVVSNAYGFAMTDAFLAVSPNPPCVAAGSGLVGWWQADGDTSDLASGINGTPTGNVAYGPGRVGQAFTLDGTGAINLGNPLSLQLQNFTIEAWVKRANEAGVTLGAGDAELLSYGLGGYGFGIRSDGRLFLARIGYDGVQSGAAIADTNFHHVAVTRSGNRVVFYVDGVDYPAAAYNPVFTFTSNAAIGAQGDDLSRGFLGSIDELSVYGRELSAAEIQEIYGTRGAGKCVEGFPAYIVVQPKSTTAFAGTDVAFNVVAVGTPPLYYQWRFNETAIPGATNSTLVITNVQVANVGTYSVLVTNTLASVASSNATLTLTFPPVTVRAIGTNLMAGHGVSVPVVVVANGIENTLQFSLSFLPSRLTFANVEWGSGVAGADTLFLDSTMAASGRLGFTVALPPGATLSAGTQEVVTVNFTSPVLQPSAIVNVAFSDQPVARRLTDVYAQSLSANYSGATVTLTPSDLEADAAPRSGGNRLLSTADLGQIARYVAHLDTPASGGEFQRADCAPRSTRGDGQLKATDWVQAGRYVLALDPLTAAGGPASEETAVSPPTGPFRQVFLTQSPAVPGSVLSLPINLQSAGDENALGFTLNFDPLAFRFLEAETGRSANAATLVVNTNDLALGSLGIFLGLQTGNTFGAGSREIIIVRFMPLLVGDYPFTLGDQPVARAVSDSEANELEADYAATSITVHSLPVLQIARFGENVQLSWPAWAADFGVQSSPVMGGWTNLNVTLQTNAGIVMTSLPLLENLRFFRLSLP